MTDPPLPDQEISATLSRISEVKDAQKFYKYSKSVALKNEGEIGLEFLVSPCEFMMLTSDKVSDTGFGNVVVDQQSVDRKGNLIF